MFNKLQHSITGWPEETNSEDTNRPERSLPKKRVIILALIQMMM
jgi:hypothetical protein